MKELWKTLAIWFLLVLTALNARILLESANQQKALAFVANETQVPTSILRIQTDDFLRGDYRVSLALPPFREISWTINRLTGQVISWQSRKKESSVLRSFLR